MTNTVRRLRGWPPRAGKLKRERSMEGWRHLGNRVYELERPAVEARDRKMAAAIIDGLLYTDKRMRLARLTKRRRWALHVAAGWLKSANAKEGAVNLSANETRILEYALRSLIEQFA